VQETERFDRRRSGRFVPGRGQGAASGGGGDGGVFVDVVRAGRHARGANDSGEILTSV
jgi:hypothetical protein